MKKKITIITLLFCSFVTGLFANTPSYDICIYGESASGVIAAIQGARMGKKVVLISKNNHGRRSCHVRTDSHRHEP